MDGLLENMLAAMIGAAIVLVVYFSKDIYQVISGRDFDSMRISVMYFTRRDFKQTSKDAFHSRMLELRVPLKKLYPNRLMFWRAILTSMSVKLEKPVLNFGSHSIAMLTPIRGQLAPLSAEGELRRAMGLSFTEVKFWICVAFDRSSHRNNYVLRAYVIREDDLLNFEEYLKNPPRTKKQDNFDLFIQIARAFKERPQTFVAVQMVMSP